MPISDQNNPFKVKKRSVRISGHSTSITLEPVFWDELKYIACQRNLSVDKLISQIDDEYNQDGSNNLSSVVRTVIFNDVKNRIK